MRPRTWLLAGALAWLTWVVARGVTDSCDRNTPHG